MIAVDAPTVRIWPVVERGLSPALMWDDLASSLATTSGGVLACPWCGLCSNLHLGAVYSATPTRDWRSCGVDIDVAAAMVTFPGVETPAAHGGSGVVVLAIEAWCDNRCRGRIEFRQHDDVVVLDLVALPGFGLEGVDPDDDGGPVAAGDPDTTEPPFLNAGR